MVLFFFFFLGAFILSYLAERKNKFAFLMLSIVLLTIGAGFRAYSVGTDTHNYHYVFNHYAPYMVYTYGQERGYLELARIIVAFFKTDRAVFVISAFITNASILSLLWLYRKKCSLSLMCFFYITLFYPETMNIMRQYIGSAIAFLCTYLLYKKKYVIYTIIILICGIVFHRAVLTSLIIAILWYAIIENGHYRKTKNIVLLLASSVFVLSPIISILNRYSRYFDNSRLQVGSMLIINSIVFIAYIYVFNTNKKKRLSSYDIKIEKFVLYTYSISLGFNVLGCFYAYMGRIGLCFSLFRMPLYAHMGTNNKYRQIFNAVNILLSLYYIVVRVALNGECGIFPYILDFHS